MAKAKTEKYSEDRFEIRLKDNKIERGLSPIEFFDKKHQKSYVGYLYEDVYWGLPMKKFIDKIQKIIPDIEVRKKVVVTIIGFITDVPKVKTVSEKHSSQDLMHGKLGTLYSDLPDKLTYIVAEKLTRLGDWLDDHSEKDNYCKAFEGIGKSLGRVFAYGYTYYPASLYEYLLPDDGDLTELLVTDLIDKDFCPNGSERGFRLHKAETDDPEAEIEPHYENILCTYHDELYEDDVKEDDRFKESLKKGFFEGYYEIKRPEWKED